jgi:hypothetical protein
MNNLYKVSQVRDLLPGDVLFVRETTKHSAAFEGKPYEFPQMPSHYSVRVFRRFWFCVGVEMCFPPIGVGVKGAQVNVYSLESFMWIDTGLIQYIGTGGDFIEFNKNGVLRSSGFVGKLPLGVNHLNAIIISKSEIDDSSVFDMNVMCVDGSQEYITHGLWQDDLVLVQVNDEQ